MLIGDHGLWGIFYIYYYYYYYYYYYFIFKNKSNIPRLKDPQNSEDGELFGKSVVPNRLRRFASHGSRKVIWDRHIMRVYRTNESKVMVAGSFYNFSRRYFHLETMYLSSHFRSFIIFTWTTEQSGANLHDPNGSWKSRPSFSPPVYAYRSWLRLTCQVRSYQH